MRRFPFLSVALLAAACGGGGGASPECQTTADCGDGERCVDHACRAASAPDAGPDVGPDVGLDVGADAERPDTGPPVGSGCSADLREVLGPGGVALRACPVDQGCSDGLCVPACEAAAASNGTVGCTFAMPTPPSYPPALPPCHAVFVANAWDGPARLSVTRGGVTHDVASFGRIADNARPASEWDAVPSTGLPAGEVAVLFLSSHPDAVMPENGVPLTCPVTPAVDAATTIGTDIGPGFVVTADVPVRAYDILPYGGARSHFPSAQLLLPANAWGTDYVLLGPPPGTHSVPGPLFLQVLSLEDAVSVRVRPTIDLPAGGALPAVSAGTTATITLDAGEYLQWEVGALDPSGTLVSADADVAVFAGNRFLRLQPTPAPGGESAHQQNLPVQALASEYVAAPYETRRADLAPEEVPYRLVGAVDDTVLSFEPVPAGAPSTLARGQVAEVRSSEPFVVRSQDAGHPFAMAQMMTTANVAGGSRPGAVAPGYGPWLGDEEFVVLFPPGQFLDEYVFFTDPAYPTTNLVLVRVRGEAGFAPVTVDCLGEVAGFRPVGDGSTYEVATVDLIRGGAPVGGCGNGRHTASSGAPFGLVVWGLDSYSSYAYPAGGNARTLADLPPLI